MEWKKKRCLLWLVCALLAHAGANIGGDVFGESPYPQRPLPFSGGVAVAYAAEKEDPPLPTLIQATTLEDDYKALSHLGLLLTPRQEREDLRKAFENILCSCVLIQMGEHFGSGSIYRMLDDEIIIATNRHVLAYWNDDSYVTFFNGRVSSGTLLGVSREADVGFISIPVSGFTWEELLSLRGVRVVLGNEDRTESMDPLTNGNTTGAENPGSSFFMVDMVSEWDGPVMREGDVVSTSIYLEDLKAQMLYGNGTAVPGMSGCGVFDGYGDYLGMLTGGTAFGEVAAVPAAVVEGEYQRLAPID